EIARMRAVRDHAVGDLAREREHLWAARRQIDRHRTGWREVKPRALYREDLALHGDRLPGEQPADDLDRLTAHGERAREAHAELGRELVTAHAETEDGASVGDLVERRHGGGEQRRVAQVRARHAGAEPDAPGRGRGQRERGVRLADEIVVGEPDVREAGVLRGTGETGGL